MKKGVKIRSQYLLFIIIILKTWGLFNNKVIGQEVRRDPLVLLRKLPGRRLKLVKKIFLKQEPPFS